MKKYSLQLSKKCRVLAGLMAICCSLMLSHQPTQGAVDVSVCGVVTGYVAAGTLTPGLITIGGVTYPLLAGVQLQGAALITANANLCLTASVNALGQITSGTLTSNAVTTTISVCGKVTALSATSITINGIIYPIASGTVIDGINAVTLGVDACLSATLNVSGQIVAPSSITVQATTTINVCGVVSALSATSITINNIVYPIASGTSITGINAVTVGVNACLSATLNVSGQIVAPSSITVQATTTVNVCGIVSALSASSITINNVIYPIAAGTNIDGINLVTVGANACLSATLNVSGQIVAPSSITVQATTTINVCGVVSALSATSITINNIVYPIASGTSITGINAVTVGVNACLSATLNVSGQIVAPSSITVQGSTTINICGVVSAISATSITINGVTYPIASGTSITGVNLVTAGVNACLSATLNVSGQIVAPSSITVKADATVNVCGVVSAISATSITISGVTYPIASGTVINGISQVIIGLNVCLKATVNASGQIIPPSSITVSTTTTISLCGRVDAYQAATATTAGSITIAGTTIPIAIGAQLAGAESIVVGANLCLNATVNASGQIITPGSVAVNINTTITICGKVTAFVAATTNTSGSITVGGVTLTIAPGVILSGITIGAEICLTTPGSGNTPSGPVGPGTTVTSVDGSCNQLKFTSPLATYGFLKSPTLPDGDLFLLKQGLNFSVVSPPPNGVEVFDVNPGTFGGTAIEVGNFTTASTGVTLQGLAVSGAGLTVRSISCTDSLQKIDFILASLSNSGSTVRLFIQNSDGTHGQELAVFTAEAGGWRVTSLNASVVLFLNNRFLSGNGQLSTGSLIPVTTPAGSAGARTGLLSLTFSKSVSSTLLGCNQLGLDVTNTSGRTSVVFTDVVVNRYETPGDTARTDLGLLAGAGGGYPTGIPCTTVCLPCNATAQTNGNTVTVSGANYDRNSVTTEGIASIFGNGFSLSIESAVSLPLPTVLAGTTVKVKDNLGVERLALLFYVSPTQINFLVPAGTAIGNAIVTVTNINGQVFSGIVKVNAVSPGLFTADATGSGAVVGTIVRVKPDGSQVIEPLGAEIDLGSNTDQVFLELYGTGIKFRSDLATVTATIGNTNSAVTYAGTQGYFVGVDQVNLLVPQVLRGSGKIKILLTVDGKVSNQVDLTIK